MTDSTRRATSMSAARSMPLGAGAFDRETPRHVQVALLGALAYFILPFDFLPDMLPVLGFTDDAAVLATAIRMVASNITPEHREAARAALKRGLPDAEA